MKRLLALALIAMLALACVGCASKDASSNETSTTPEQTVKITLNAPADTDATITPALIAIEPDEDGSPLPSRAFTVSRHEFGSEKEITLPQGNYFVSVIAPVNSNSATYTPLYPERLTVGNTEQTLSLSLGSPIAIAEIPEEVIEGMAIAAQRCYEIDNSISEDIPAKLLSLAETAIPANSQKDSSSDNAETK